MVCLGNLKECTFSVRSLEQGPIHFSDTIIATLKENMRVSMNINFYAFRAAERGSWGETSFQISGVARLLGGDAMDAFCVHPVWGKLR